MRRIAPTCEGFAPVEHQVRPHLIQHDLDFPVAPNRSIDRVVESPPRPVLASYEAMYSVPVGEFAWFLQFLNASVSCVLGGSAGALALGMKQAGFSITGARSELGAGFRAMGLAAASGRPAIVTTVGGAAAAALAQPLFCAAARGTPVIAITGEVDSKLAGQGAVQDGTGRDGPSITQLLAAVTCRSVAVHSPDEAWRELVRGVELATIGAGNVHISIPSDVQRQLFKGGER